MGSCSCPRAAGVSCPPGARVASCSPTVRMRQARQAGGVRTVGEHGARSRCLLRRWAIRRGVAFAELGPGGVGADAGTGQRRQVVIGEAVP